MGFAGAVFAALAAALLGGGAANALFSALFCPNKIGYDGYCYYKQYYNDDYVFHIAKLLYQVVIIS